MSKRRRGSVPLYAARHGYVYCTVNRLCVECGAKLTGRKRAWCGQECANNFRIRAWPGHARRLVMNRDLGICAHCGLDCIAVARRVHELPRRGKVWSADRGWHDCEGNRSAIKFILRPHGMARHWRRGLAGEPSFWDADHIIGVANGGGEMGMDNLRTLCLRCHAIRTRLQTRARRCKVRTRRITSGPIIQVRRVVT